MNTGILERIRQLHADIEQHRTEIAHQRCVPIKHQRHQILADHYVLRKVRQIQEKAASVLDLYDDEDFQKAAEAPLTVASALKEFEEQCSATIRYNQAHPQPPHSLGTLDELSVDDEEQYVRFSGAERHGRCLDLHEHYARFVTFMHVTATYDTMPSALGGGGKSNATATGLLKVVDAVATYPSFVKDLVQVLSQIPPKRKLADVSGYTAFVSSLSRYLKGFHDRIRPLQIEETTRLIQETRNSVRSSFAVAPPPSSSSSSSTGGHTASAAFVVLGWEQAHLPHVLPVDRRPTAQIIAEEEALIQRIYALLPVHIEATLAFHERKITKTVEELEIEAEEEDETFRREFAEANRQSILNSEAMGSSSSTAAAAALVNSTVLKDAGVTADDLNKAILEQRGGGKGANGGDESDPKYTNVKNFPLDADGKPIPVWLYHLHGLHLPYYCEICAYTYHGERAFTMHFQEPRHVKGLERLGIDVTLPQLHLVSRREEAMSLFSQVQRNAQRKRARPEDEEIENIDGMVMTREELQSLHRRGGAAGAR